MSLSPNQVLHIAKLARLQLTPDEVKKYQQELSSILAFVEQLKQVDTKQVAPTYQVTGLTNRTRPDEVNYTFTREQMLASAIETAEDHIKVKGVFNHD